MFQPSISVIIPVFNQEKYIKRCIDSVLEQTLKNVEILVIDDGSTDNTSLMLAHYKNKIEVYHSQNKGPGGARNIGLDNASGKYVFFLDSDDWISFPNALEELYNYIDTKKLDILLYNFYKVTCRKKKKTILNYMNYGKIYNGDEILDMFLLGNISRFPWDKMYKNELIKKINFRFPEKLWFEDIYQVVLLASAERIAKIDYFPYSYWVSGYSITRSYSSKIYDKEKVCYKTIEKLEEFGLLYNKADLVDYFVYNTTILSQFYDAINKGKYSDLKEIVNYVCNDTKFVKYKYFYKKNNLPLKHKLYLLLIFKKCTPILYLKKITKWLKLK